MQAQVHIISKLPARVRGGHKFQRTWAGGVTRQSRTNKSKQNQEVPEKRSSQQDECNKMFQKSVPKKCSNERDERDFRERKTIYAFPYLLEGLQDP